MINDIRTGIIELTQLKRYLICSSDERTWKFDQPVIFLGEWCRLYDRKHVWKDMDAIVALPYGLGKANKDSDYSDARKLEGMLLPELCNVLNQYHGVYHDQRFWQIVLGHWLRRYVDVMLNRVKTLTQCLRTYPILGTTLHLQNPAALIMLDSYSASFAFNDEYWNNALISRIFNLLKINNFPIEVITDHSSDVILYKKSIKKPSLKKTFLNFIHQKLKKLTYYLVRDEDGFIINSYLPRKEEIKLHLVMGQCPQLWDLQKYELTEEPNLILREMLTKNLVIGSENYLKDVLFAMVFELLPICYLEGFSNMKKICDQQPWPKKPKFIFTSNNFDTDEIFKLWTATKVESGVKYIVGQHGNNYETYRYAFPTIEEVTADKFLTWGWVGGLQQHIPAFILKTAGRKAQHYNFLGGIILIELHAGFRLFRWDNTYEYNTYFEEQQKFINKLDLIPKQQLTIRLHSAYRQHNWSEEARWEAFDPSIKIDFGNIPISDLISESRLIVYSYDSTGILETLAQNIPTLAFWQNGFDHLQDNAKPYYQLLEDVGIIHLTPESVAHKVNKIWDDVDAWWMQSEVQEARKVFCEKYARQCQNPIHKLKQIIKSSMK